MNFCLPSVLAWTQAMESSLQQPATVASSEISLTYVGGVLAVFALLWALSWIFNSVRRQHDRVHLRHNQPHFFWMPRKK